MKIVIKYDEKTNEARASVAFDKNEQTNFFDAMPYCMDALNDLYQKLAKAAMLRGYEYLEEAEPLVEGLSEEELEEQRKAKVRNIVDKIMKGREQ